MAENLEIFGQTYTNVSGIKAYDINNNIQTYIKPQGTKTITENGTGIDVSAFAMVDVSVSGRGGSSYELIATQEYEVNTTSTTATKIDTITLPTLTGNKILYVQVFDKSGPTDGRFYGCIGMYMFVNGVTSSNSATLFIRFKYARRNNFYSTASDKYGVYPNYATRTSLDIYRRYNSSQTGTLNGTFVVNVYLLDWATGRPF